jgi:hypothetical protein
MARQAKSKIERNREAITQEKSKMQKAGTNGYMTFSERTFLSTITIVRRVENPTITPLPIPVMIHPTIFEA